MRKRLLDFLVLVVWFGVPIVVCVLFIASICTAVVKQKKANDWHEVSAVRVGENLEITLENGLGHVYTFRGGGENWFEKETGYRVKNEFFIGRCRVAEWESQGEVGGDN